MRIEWLFVPPYISVRRTGGGLQIGGLYPCAHTIHDPPAFLERFLIHLSRPRPYDEARRFVIGEGWTGDEAEALLDDLRGIGALATPFAADDRYARHRLFFHMQGARDDVQPRLRNATVALLGMGGIGSHLATHLVAAGIGRLLITDGDRIELSNLTRQTLYTESDCGSLKVDAAARRLKQIRDDIVIEAIPQALSAEVAAAVCPRADFVCLSADKPSAVHEWTNAACIASGVPFSNAGYIEAVGIVGPLCIPGQTPCYDCQRAAGEASAKARLQSEELNPAFQAPSYGPLNAIVAAVQANECIRHLAGLETATRNRRLLIDSATYECSWEDMPTDVSCGRCGYAPGPDRWSQIAAMYDEERVAHSAVSLVLDPVVPGLLPPSREGRVADVGAGTGTLAAAMARDGWRVDAFEPAGAMFERLEAAARAHGFRAVRGGLDDLGSSEGDYAALTCMNVVDHIEDLPRALAKLHEALRPGGALILSVPHPMKDRGGWLKEDDDGAPTYKALLTDQYFLEGPCFKDREDRHGVVRVTGVRTYHRTIETYVNACIQAGFAIDALLEPSPAETGDRTVRSCSRNARAFPISCLFGRPGDDATGQRPAVQRRRRRIRLPLRRKGRRCLRRHDRP